MLVGVVACVSMAVAVWSIAKVHAISNSCEACKEAIDSEIIGEVYSDRIDYWNHLEMNSPVLADRIGRTSYSMTGLLPSVLACVTCLDSSTGFIVCSSNKAISILTRGVYACARCHLHTGTHD